MIPVAVGLIIGARSAIVLGEKLGAKLAVAGGLLIVAVGMQILSQRRHRAPATAWSPPHWWSSASGMGIAMTPATEAIMGSLPKEKAGVGSAMNDVLREVGGTLGVAVLGSLLASKYAGGMADRRVRALGAGRHGQPGQRGRGARRRRPGG